MEVEFRNEELEDLYQGKKVKSKLFKSNQQLVKSFVKTVTTLENVPDLNTLKQIGSLNLENLSGDRTGYSSVRVNNKYRLIIELVENEQEEVKLIGIEELTNHYS